MSIGSKIKEYRQLKGISQKELAFQLGIAPNTLYRYEHGDITVSAETLTKIADILCIPVEKLLERPKNITFDEKPDSNAAPLTAEQLPEIIKNVKEQLIEIHDTLEKSFSKLNIAGKMAVNNYAKYLTTQEEFTKPDEE